jgi:CRISPR/Cas system-associated protein Csm6
MSDEIQLQQDTNRAARAKALLDNELLQEAFKNLEESYINAWRVTKHDDELGREKLFLAVNVIGKVKEHLLSIVANGKLAQAELNKLHADAERKKRFGLI